MKEADERAEALIKWLRFEHIDYGDQLHVDATSLTIKNAVLDAYEDAAKAINDLVDNPPGTTQSDEWKEGFKDGLMAAAVAVYRAKELKG